MNIVISKRGGSSWLKSVAAAISSRAQQICQSRIHGRRPERSFLKNRLTWISVFTVLMTSLLNAGNASAQAITTKSTAGTYLVTCDGYLTFPNPICSGEVARDDHRRYQRSLYGNFAVECRRFCGRDTDGVWNGGIESERHWHHYLCHDDRWQSRSSPQYQFCRIGTWQQIRRTLHRSRHGFFLRTPPHFQRRGTSGPVETRTFAELPSGTASCVVQYSQASRRARPTRGSKIG
jgi:hypothetical protein